MVPNGSSQQAGGPKIDRWYEEEERIFDDAEPEGGEPTDADLERMYDSGTARIVTQRNDFLLPGLLDSMKNETYINLTPPYQRRLRWDRKRKSRLIESLLMNIPIPPVFLFETELAKYEVMDGQQRLSTIREFFGNEFQLNGLEKWSSLNGRRYGQLPSRIQSGLQRRSISAIILLAESDSEIKRFAFERLNTGGVRLNPHEIRNALHGGAFNDLLHELSRGELFTGIWNIPPRETNEDRRPSQRLASNRFYNQMLDCEIVLRFFTLAEPDRMSTSMRGSLDDTMKRCSTTEPDIDQMRGEFTQCLETAHQIYGDATFRLLPQRSPSGSQRRTLSRALYDAVMLGLLNVKRGRSGSAWPAARSSLRSEGARIADRTNDIMAQRESYGLLVGRLNTKRSIAERINLMTSVFEEALETRP